MKFGVHGLIDKRAETVGKVEAQRDQLAQLMADLDYLDRCIRIFEPDIDLASLPNKSRPAAERGVPGEAQRFLLNAIRASESALTTLALARAIMEASGLNTADKALCRLISRRTGHSLCSLRTKGFLRSEKANAGVATLG